MRHRARFILLLIALISCLRVSCVVWADDAPAKGLLIVAPERFHETLEPYVVHKQQQLPTKLISLERALADSTGVDDPEKLKRRLFEAWKSGGVGYVLLVGDADVSPVRFMTLDRVQKSAFDYSFYACDLYYADLAKQDGAFDDWNANKDSFHAEYYGEVHGEKNKQDPINFDQVDYRPDVAVGRWPVSTVESLAVVVSKTIAYEESVLAGSKPGLRRAAFMNVAGWVDARRRMDDMIHGLPSGWTVDKRYFVDDHRDDKTPPPDRDQLVALLNEGAGLVFHAGHGQWDQWEQCVTLSDFEQVHNADRLPIIISAGCTTAQMTTQPPYGRYVDIHGRRHRGTDAGEVFDGPPPPPRAYQRGKCNPTSLGEQLLRGGPDGAVAYIGCNTGAEPCDLTLLDGFVATMRNSSTPRLGDCWNGAVSYYYDRERLAHLRPSADWYPPSIFFQAMKFMFFGDPSLVMPPSAGEQASAP